MTDDLAQLYRDVILDHSKRPRNFGRLPSPTRTTEGHNRSCGDRLTLYVKIEADTLTDIRFEGSGCAIDTAAASLMTEAVKGRGLAEVLELFDRFHGAMTEGVAGELPFPDLGKLAALQGVRKYPVRVKCATLPWHTLRAALSGDAGANVVSTESAE